MRYLFLAIWLILFGSISSKIYAQTNDQVWQWTYQANYQLLGRHYWQADIQQPYQQQTELYSKQYLKGRYQQAWQLELNGRAIVNTLHTQRTRLWLNEAYVGYRQGDWYARLGKQVVKWGALTGWSSLDLVNRYDYYDFLDTEKEELGQWGGEIRWSKGMTEIKVLGLLPQQPSRLYLFDNRWVNLPQRLPISEQPPADLPFQPTGIVDSQVTRIPQIGLSLSTELGKVNLRASAYLGSNDIPQTSIRLLAINTNGASYDLFQQYHNIGIGAINATTYLGEWNVWGELSLVRSKRLSTPQQTILQNDNYGFVSVGIDRTWSFPNPEQYLQLMAQYIQKMAYNDQHYRATELDHIFNSTVVLQLDWRMNYRWNWAIRGVTDFKQFSNYWRSNWQYQVSPTWQIGLQLDWLTGSHDHLFGYFHHNSRVAIRLEATI